MNEDEAESWRAVGRRLGEARRQRRLSKRGAADLAGFSDITWRQLEAGERQVSREVKVPVSPKDDTLVAAARAVGLDAGELFELVGRPWDPDLYVTDDGPDLEARFEGFEDRLSRVEQKLTELGRRRRQP